MKIIFKYELQVQSIQKIDIPSSSEILDIQIQDGKIMMWAIVDGYLQKMENNGMQIIMYGTGQQINLKYVIHIGTVQLSGCVWHFFRTTDD